MQTECACVADTPSASRLLLLVCNRRVEQCCTRAISVAVMQSEVRLQVAFLREPQIAPWERAHMWGHLFVASAVDRRR